MTSSGMGEGGSGDGVILMVDDNAADVDLAREAFADSVFVGALHVVGDGVQALAFLRREGQHTSAPRPDLVVLDLNMPRLDGRAVLAAAKNDPALCDIPVIVFSSSTAPPDVAEAYRLGANCYVLKPVLLRDFVATMRAMEQFWIGLAMLPGRRQHSTRWLA